MCVNLVVNLCVFLHSYVIIVLQCLYLFFVCLYVCCVLLCSLPGKKSTVDWLEIKLKIKYVS